MGNSHLRPSPDPQTAGERIFQGEIHFLARATLEEDGVRFHYEFTNRSDKRYDMIYAVTDPRMTDGPMNNGFFPTKWQF